MLDVLQTETRRITGVLEGFRDFASVAQLNRSTVDLCQLIVKLVRFVEPQARQQHVHVSTALPVESPAPIIVDAVRIEQVLLNLVVNALAAMPDGGELTIRLREASDAVYVDVLDTGSGIPDDLHDKVFDPYFTTRSTGTGMGLAISEKIVRQHDGTIDFRTSSGGTVFTIALPRSELS